MEDWYGGLTNRRAGSSTDRSVERMRLSQGRFSAGLVIIHELPRRCLLGNCVVGSSTYRCFYQSAVTVL
jgi:hypothetical protein